MDWKQHWPWWKRGIIYQVYPRSFFDSNGDGCGDLAGIAHKLDYLRGLGVGALWISPFYPSPMKDFGYDISDYTAVHPLFGSMADFETLLRQAHEHGLRVILDLVPNHTSDQHPWFQESASARDSPKRDWYLWRDPDLDGAPPNNWISEFAGSAWQWHEPTGQYYYHAFLAAQPDLNWRNPEVRQAIYDAMRFWLDKGVDGFRVDVMWHMVKDEQFRNNPPNPDFDPQRESPYAQLLPVYSTDQPYVHDVVREMRQVMDEYDALLIGEIYLPIEKLVTYYGEEESEAHLPFNFQLLSTPWDAAQFRSVIDTYEASLGANDWPNWVLGNHDKTRIATRIGRQQARVAAVLLLTLRGTPTMYYGDEIGMTDGEIPPEDVVDPRELQCPGKGLGRDPARTPMQWDDTKAAGFTTAEPWLPVASNYERCNVAGESGDPMSMLSLYRRLIELRQKEPALAVGLYEPLPADGPLLAYQRRHDHSAFLVVLNFSAEPQMYHLTAGLGRGELVLSTHLADVEDRKIEGMVELGPDEAVVVRVVQ